MSLTLRDSRPIGGDGVSAQKTVEGDTVAVIGHTWLGKVPE